MAVININEYTSGDFITIKEYPALIRNNEVINFTNYDVNSFKIWITADYNDTFGPCENGCCFKTGTGWISGTGRYCKIIVVDLRYKSFSQRISNIVRRYIVEDGITQTVSFDINIEIGYKLDADMDNSQRYSAIEDLIEDTVKGKRIDRHEIEKKIIECFEELFPNYINKKVNEYCGINSFSQLSSLITNIKNECHQLKKELSEEITSEISQKFSCISVEVRRLEIVIPEETKIEQEANRFAILARDARMNEIQAITMLKIKAKEKLLDLCVEYVTNQIRLPQEQMNLISQIYASAYAADANTSELPVLLEKLQNINTSNPLNIIEMSKMITTQLGLEEGNDK